jgi:hypothetical protein
MQRYRRLQRRRAVLYLVDWFVIVLFLIVWIVARKPVPTGRTISHNKAPDHIIVRLAKPPELTERAISYNKAPGHILVQLVELHEFPGAETHTVPVWTLYGDGTLIFRIDPTDALWRAQLAPGDIQHILDVILNQGRFFDDTRKQYGSISPESDDGLLLTVDAKGQRKKVVLVSELTNQTASDIQTFHVFAIAQFLLAYHPVHSDLYALNPDLDDRR